VIFELQRGAACHKTRGVHKDMGTEIDLMLHTRLGLDIRSSYQKELKESNITFTPFQNQYPLLFTTLILMCNPASDEEITDNLIKHRAPIAHRLSPFA